MNNPINAPKIPSLGLKFSFPIHKFQTWKPAPKGLDYRYAGFQILDWNYNFQSSPVWTNEKLQRIFFFLQRPIYDKIPIDKIYLLLLSIKKRTATVP